MSFGQIRVVAYQNAATTSELPHDSTLNIEHARNGAAMLFESGSQLLKSLMDSGILFVSDEITDTFCSLSTFRKIFVDVAYVIIGPAPSGYQCKLTE